MLALIASLFLSGAAHTKAITPLTPRSYTGEECGVSYPTSERLECGVREYNSCPAVSCPGHIPAETFETHISAICSTPSNCNNQRQAKAQQACSRPVSFRGPGKLVSFWMEGSDIVASCQSAEVIKSCPAQACGPKSFNACFDLAKPSNNTCSLLMNRSELEDYTSTLNAEIETNARLFAIYKASFLIQAKQKTESACFIKKFENNEQYFEVIDSLKIRFEDLYKEPYVADAYVCDDSVNTSEVLNFRELRCASIPESEVLSKLNDSSLDIGYQRFYGNCLAQKAYQTPENWFRFNLAEINRLLGDVVASKEEGVAQSLRNLKAEMEAKKIGGPE